jgi:electron transfer flavoprotein beta subunit
METVVLVKRVPDTETLVRIAPDAKGILLDGARMVMNPYDEIALEEALRLRDIHGGAVCALSAGGEKTVETLRTALAMGADKAVLLTGLESGSADSLTLARAIAAFLRSLPFDLVLAGARAVDDDGYQVGPMVAEFLGIPQLTFAVRVLVEGGAVTCHRAVDGETVVARAALPALVTAHKGLNQPRFASVVGIMKAQKKPVETVTLAGLALPEGKARVETRSVRLAPERAGGLIIQGETPEEKAKVLVRALADAGAL